jgi:hypothetical protein
VFSGTGKRLDKRINTVHPAQDIRLGKEETMRYGDHLRKRISGTFCVYCGVPATETEHFPPASTGSYGWLLPACRECNQIAGDRHPYDFEARCNFVKSGIAHYARENLLPASLDAELDKDDYEWETFLKRLSEARAARRRLAWSAAAYLSSIGGTKLFAVKPAKTATTTKSAPKLGVSIETPSTPKKRKQKPKTKKVPYSDLRPMQEAYARFGMMPVGYGGARALFKDIWQGGKRETVYYFRHLHPSYRDGFKTVKICALDRRLTPNARCDMTGRTYCEIIVLVPLDD